MVLGLVADVGGTNTRLRLIQLDHKGHMTQKFEKTYESTKFKTLADPINIFLRDECKGTIPTVACLAVAGPVTGNTANITNLKWILVAEEIAAATGIKHVQLVNDFAAIGYGLPELGPNDYVSINPDCKPVTGGTLACLGAGTGLGEVYATFDGYKNYSIFPTEGGHVDFAPRNQLEWDLMQYTKKVLNVDRVSVEMCVSGRAMPRIYGFLAERHPEWALDAATDAKIRTPDGGAIITSRGMAGTDPLCVKALEMFVNLYGCEAGNFSLKVFPKGGLFLAGGIAKNIIPKLQQPALFMDHFKAKGVMSQYMGDFPVYVILHENVGVLGAKMVCRKLCIEHNLLPPPPIHSKL